MPIRQKITEDAKISAAALHLAANGWNAVTLDKISKVTKIRLANLKQRFASPLELISLIVSFIDDEAFADFNPAGNAHDVLFDLMMARFDILQEHRTAILNITTAARSDRALSWALAKATLNSLYRLIEASKLKHPKRLFLVAGLTGVYGWAFFIWRQDKSSDLSKTMAALDRSLSWADKGVGVLDRYFDL